MCGGRREALREVQFHPAYQYEDFVEGYVPAIGGGFTLADKHLLEMAAVAEGSNDPVVLVIDELTRTDPSRVMGEVLTYMERSLRGIEFRLPSGRAVKLPANLVFLATANLEDRSVDQLDAAMERRWSKILLSPDTGQVAAFLAENGMSQRDIRAISNFFNAIQEFIPIGHAYFRKVASAAAMERLWARQIRPQLQSRHRYEPAQLAASIAVWDACRDIISAPPAAADDAAPQVMPAVVEPRVLTLASRSSIELGISELLIDGALPLYRHVEEKGLVFLSLRKGRITLSAGAYVGLIPLNARLSVDILPKLPVGNLARVLEIARAPLGRLRRTLRTYQLAEAPEASVLAFIAANLVDAVRDIEVAGFTKQFTPEKAVTSHPRGRILIGESRSRCLFRGRPSSVVAERYRQTTDVLANRIIRASMQIVLSAFSRMSLIDAALLSDTASCYRNLPNEIGVLTQAERSELAAQRGPGHTTTGRPDYDRALEIATMVLNTEGILLDRQGPDRSLNSFILNLEEVIENYFRNSLRRRAPSDVVVEDGNKEGRRPLFSDQPNGPLAQPDIVLRRVPSPPIVCEIKYKTKIDRPDINQAVTYAVTFGVRLTVLIHIEAPNTKHGLYKLGQTGDVAVYGYAFNLSAVDLDQEEKALAASLTSLLDPHQPA